MQEFLAQIVTHFGTLVDGFPWFVVLVIYIGEKLQQRSQGKADKAQQSDLIKAINDALTRAQEAAHGASPTPAPPVASPTPPAPHPAPVAPTPLPSAPKPQPIPTGPAPLVTGHIDLASLRDEYLQDWQVMTVKPGREATVESDAKKVLAHKDAYQAVETATGVPWWALGIIDMMEGGGGADTNPCNGQTLKRRTTNVPAGRPPAPAEPPFTFQQAAVDAMTYMGFDKIKTWTIDVVSWVFEKQNGFGYRQHHLRSPYLYGFSSLEQPGKYVSDHNFDPTAVNEQAGALTILKALIALDPSIKL